MSVQQPAATMLTAAALQLEAVPASSLAMARAALLPALNLARQRGARLAVLPAHLGLSLLPTLVPAAPATWEALGAALPATAASLGSAWAGLSADLARASGLLLLAGTTPAMDSDGRLRNRAYLFGPGGAPLGWQDQTHPGPRERALGIVPADSLEPIDTPYGKVGIIIGDDVLLPEVAAILALQGATILLHPTATTRFSSPEWQRRLWREVQSHQVFGVEAPLIGSLCGEHFSGRATIHAPVELTTAGAEHPRGVLAQAVRSEGEAMALGAFDERERRELVSRQGVAQRHSSALYRSMLSW